MGEDAFDRIAAEEWERIPPRFKEALRNVALLIEDEPDLETREREGLHGEDTLLGIYQGIPNTERGIEYGVGGTLPDTITLYRLPILHEATDVSGEEEPPEDAVRTVIRETIWHEVGHYFGFDEPMIQEREDGGSNHFHTCED